MAVFLRGTQANREKFAVTGLYRRDKLEHGAMLTARHEAAEVLRHMRWKAFAAPRSHRYTLVSWLFAMLGLLASDENENHAALRAGTDLASPL